MVASDKIKSLLDEIRAYDRANYDLQSAHHFLFAKSILRGLPDSNVVLMGFNPGETKSDWLATNGERSEETFEYDFHYLNRSSAAKRWVSSVEYFLGSSDVYMTEFFFWSSKNISELIERYGSISIENPHFKFCKKINTDFIQATNASKIVFTGLTHFSKVAKIHGLRKLDTITSNGNILVIVAIDEFGRNWFFTKHWTGSFGLSKEQKNIIKEVIAV
jgi:hypothetical protein